MSLRPARRRTVERDPREEWETATTASGPESFGLTDGPARDAPPDLRVLIADAVLPVDGVAEIGPGTSVRIFALSFYAGVDLVVRFDPAWRPEGLQAVWLFEGGRFHRLDRTLPPIHAVNLRVSPRLMRATILPYLRFFCYFVRGGAGPFLILEPGMSSLVSPAITKALADDLVTAEVLGQDRSDNWHCAAIVYYGEVVFAARFGNGSSGLLEMIADEPVHEDLPAAPPTPLRADADVAG